MADIRFSPVPFVSSPESEPVDGAHSAHVDDDLASKEDTQASDNTCSCTSPELFQLIRPMQRRS